MARFFWKGSAVRMPPQEYRKFLEFIDRSESVCWTHVFLAIMNRKLPFLSFWSKTSTPADKQHHADICSWRQSLPQHVPPFPSMDDFDAVLQSESAASFVPFSFKIAAELERRGLKQFNASPLTTSSIPGFSSFSASAMLQLLYGVSLGGERLVWNTSPLFSVQCFPPMRHTGSERFKWSRDLQE
jgi:hypothetical protein